ncbi:zinc finger protein [Plasmodium gonderi]|uniref:Zinc finger protein n=1 Tax=Plasmodium gonderi TaxID=77519 RepID=A0A1Y1JK39_PLAGO|nr:zinc finger protein [Plasmodium gonderi]GAW82821.1 zinc finger protein [Plasmodium gonderi]
MHGFLIRMIISSNNKMKENIPNINERGRTKRKGTFRSLYFSKKKNDKPNGHNKSNMTHMFTSDIIDTTSLNDNQKEMLNEKVSKSNVYDLEIANLRVKNKFQFIYIHGAENNSSMTYNNGSNERDNNATSIDVNLMHNTANDNVHQNTNYNINNIASNNHNDDLSCEDPNHCTTIITTENENTKEASKNTEARDSPVHVNAYGKNETNQEKCSNETSNDEEVNNTKLWNIWDNLEEVRNGVINNESNCLIPNEGNSNENVMNENATNENVTNENATNENATNENATNENATNENVTNENVTNETEQIEHDPMENSPSESAPNEDIDTINHILPPTNDLRIERNIETQNELFTSMQNRNEVVNDTRRSRNSVENASNQEELDYYVLTIRDLRNTNVNESEYENDEGLELSFYQRCIIWKLLGYEIKPILEEYNLNKAIRIILFIFMLLALFSIEFTLLYNNLLKVKTEENQFLLVESNYNKLFVNNFLFQFNEKELKNWHLTNDIIKDEITKGNYMLHNNMCEVISKLNVNCDNLLEFYNKNNEINKEKLIEKSIKIYDELKKRNMCIYRVMESLLEPCNEISTRTLNNGNNYIFLFVMEKKHLKISSLFLMLTLFFFCLRIALILSRILYDFVLFVCFKNYRLSVESKRKYLAKYMWSVSTILFLEVILGDGCVVWWLHDIDPIFNYYFQYFIWYISLFCLLSCITYKIFRKCAERHDHNNCSAISYSLQYIHDFLFGMNIVFACIFIVLNINKAIVITIIVTDIVLFIDILNDSYLEQMQLTNFQEFPTNPQRKKKKYYIIENKKKKRKKFTLIRMNEHIYQEVTLESISEKHGNKNKGDNMDVDNTGGGKKWHEKKNRIFNLKNVFNKKYLKKKNIFKNVSNSSKEAENGNENNNHGALDQNNSLDNPVISSLEYCEICDERFKNVVLYPCMHGGFCETCIRSMIFNSLKLKDSFPNCPLCRDAIKNVYKISYEDYQKKVQAVTILTIRAKH